MFEDRKLGESLFGSTPLESRYAKSTVQNAFKFSLLA